MSGADQQALGIWCRRVLRDYGVLAPASEREIKKRLDADTPTGVELASVVLRGRLCVLVAARGFRAREPVERRAETLDAVARVLSLLMRGNQQGQRDSAFEGVVSDLAAKGGQVTQGSDRNEAEEVRERLLLSERWASVGQLAAGVAHAVNNPLAALLANLQALGGQLKGTGEADPDEVADVLRESVDAIERIATTVDELRAFARIDREEVGQVDVNDVVRAATRLAHNELRHRARLSLELAPLPPILADRTKLAQLVMNLLVNAAHAFDDSAANCTVTVRTELDGGYVRISVEDNGSGISPPHMDRVFQPFFTTKPPSEGIGLGLSVAREIAHRHNGHIELTSTPGEGTRAEVVLPVITGLVAHTTSIPPSSLRAHHRARILLIDDEPSVLRAFARLLRKRHEVVTAPGGAEALAVLNRDQAFDVILCDVMMPEVDGVAVFEGAARINPNLTDRIVFCTGGECTERARSFVARTDNPVLAKPVDAGVLEDAIAAVVANRLADEERGSG